jgi:hypothetical protein
MAKLALCVLLIAVLACLCSATTCVTYLTTTANPKLDCCDVPTLYCIHLVDSKQAGDQPSQTCTLENNGDGKFTLSQPGQKVYLSSDPQGKLSPYFDELGYLTVKNIKNGQTNGANYIAWQNDCAVAGAPFITISNAQPPNAPAIEITELFGGEVGDFELNLNVWNKYNPYSNLDAYVCTGSALQAGLNAEVTESTTQQMNGNGLSTSMTVFIAVGSAIGTTLLVAAIATLAGFAVVRKSSGTETLHEKLVVQ